MYKQDLAERIQAGDSEALNEFVVANLGLVYNIVRRYSGSGTPVDQEDLIQEGVLGLIHAVEKFDWNRNIKFSTYASIWIRKYVSVALANKGRTIRIPIAVDDQVRKLIKTQDRLTYELGRPATDQELADVLGIQSDDVRRLLSYNEPPGVTDDEAMNVPLPEEDVWTDVATWMQANLTEFEQRAVLGGDFESDTGVMALKKLKEQFLD